MINLRLQWSVPTLVLLSALSIACDGRPPSAEDPPEALADLDTSVFEPAVGRQIDEALARAAAAPEDAVAQGDLGRVLHAYQLNEPASAAYARAIALAPEVFRWRYLRGRALQAAGEHDEAMVVLTDALALRSDYPPLRVAIGNLLLDAGEAAAAYGHYRDAARQDPLSTQARFGIARVLASRGESEAAAAAYLATLESAPEFGAAHYALGLLYRDLGETALAAEHLARAESYQGRKVPSRDPLMGSVAQLAAGAQSLTKQALREHAAGRVEQALQLLLQAVEKDPTFVPARVNLIKLYSDAGRYEDAEEHYRAAILANPNAQQARFNYARSLVQQRRVDEALAELEAVIEINPNFADAQVLLGSVFDDRGEPERAEAHYRLAVASKPAHPQANLMLALHRLEAGDLASAQEHAERLLRAETESLPILIYRLGVGYAEAGRRGEAREYFEEARRQAVVAGRQRLVAEIDSRLGALG